MGPICTSRRGRATRVAAVGIAVVTAAALGAGCSPGGPQEPKNVIVLVGDGMSYNQIDLASSYENGTTNWQVRTDPSSGSVVAVPGTPSQPFEEFDVNIAVTTYSVSGGYDPEAAWSDPAYLDEKPTDSAAAATAMATGVKTYDAGIGVDADGNPVESLTERAAALGKATGVVTSVPLSHATPAGFGAHDVERDNLVAIADDYLASDLDVVMGAGHPLFGDDHAAQEPDYKYIAEESWAALTSGATPFTLVQAKSDFEALVDAQDPPDRVFGVAEVFSTLQQRRSGDDMADPYEVPFNDVPELRTLALGALNVLEQDPDGFFLMVEGGAVDLASHKNQTGRVIEEALAFNDMVDAVVEWVDTRSSWDETLVIVTADHETGHLSGPGSDDGPTPLTGSAGQVPALEWHSEEHTNSLVPLFAQGVGAQAIDERATATDPVRGRYADNTVFAKLLLDELWKEASA